MELVPLVAFCIVIIGIILLIRNGGSPANGPYKRLVVNNRPYMVIKHHKNHVECAHLLNQVEQRLCQLVSHMSSKTTNELYSRMRERMRYTTFWESSKEDDHETFTRDKGERMVFCTRDEGTGTLHDLNTLMFVGIHELAHVYSTSYHHTEEFWRNFKMLLKEGTSIGIYKPVDYSSTPTSYCKMTIQESPLF